MRKLGKLLCRLLVLLLILAAAGIGYMYLKPMLSVQEEATYTAYTVSRGNISTEKSFSASISVAYNERHQNTTRATSIREIYVTSGQAVRKGDKLMLLDNGELLKAGLDGIVTEMRFNTNDWLWNNVDLIQINDLTNLKVSLSVDEYDVRNVTAGQKCYVTIVPTGEVFETEISHVDRVSASSGQVAYYTASAELTATEHVLPGMTASVTIPSDQADNVLVLDMAALAFDEEKQPYVLRQTATGYERVPVMIGLSNGMQVEITSGLNENDVVWAVAGKETVQNPFSLVDLYKKLMGEKIIINDMTDGQSGRNGFSGFPMPGRENTVFPNDTGSGIPAMTSGFMPPSGEGEEQDFDNSSRRFSGSPGTSEHPAATDEAATTTTQEPVAKPSTENAESNPANTEEEHTRPQSMRERMESP